MSASFVGKNRFDFLVEVVSEDVVRKMAPDFARLALIEVRGVIVTAKSASPQYDDEFVAYQASARGGVVHVRVCRRPNVPGRTSGHRLPWRTSGVAPRGTP